MPNPPPGVAPSAIPGLVIAAPRSGSGKTTVTLGLLRALRRDGLIVQAYKCGPDYIDPAFHAAATGRPSYNLDTWAMNAAAIRALVADTASTSGIAIAEGVMGLFDGAGVAGASGQGSSADLAHLLQWPVVLVLDVAGQAETAAALALGCKLYRTDIDLAGVILNNVASDRQIALIAPALARLELPLFGTVRRDAKLRLPERHLGLVQASETTDLETRLDNLADTIVHGVDLKRLAAAARPSPPSGDPERMRSSRALHPPGQRIALASDAAFAFMYPHLLHGWRAAGAEILPFSPLRNEAPAATADAVWLPGGYPELHAGTLAAAERFRSGLSRCAASGIPVHGECGGYMVLGTGLEDARGTRHAMTGLLPLETSISRRKLHLGYRRATLEGGSILGAAGARVLGHEFHYATTLSAGGDPLAICTDARGTIIQERGARVGNVSGTFFHVIAAEPEA